MHVERDCLALANFSKVPLPRQRLTQGIISIVAEGQKMREHIEDCKICCHVQISILEEELEDVLSVFPPSIAFVLGSTYPLTINTLFMVFKKPVVISTHTNWRSPVSVIGI